MLPLSVQRRASVEEHDRLGGKPPLRLQQLLLLSPEELAGAHLRLQLQLLLQLLLLQLRFRRVLHLECCLRVPLQRRQGARVVEHGLGVQDEGGAEGGAQDEGGAEGESEAGGDDESEGVKV